MLQGRASRCSPTPDLRSPFQRPNPRCASQVFRIVGTFGAPKGVTVPLARGAPPCREAAPYAAPRALTERGMAEDHKRRTHAAEGQQPLLVTPVGIGCRCRSASGLVLRHVVGAENQVTSGKVE